MKGRETLNTVGFDNRVSTYKKIVGFGTFITKKL
jgi:hypothetical protein